MCSDVRLKNQMYTTGLILASFGGILFFASILALACTKTDDKLSGAEAFDIFILGGVISFFRDLFRAIAEGIRNRTSPAFAPLVLFGVSLGLLAIGGMLLMLPGSS